MKTILASALILGLLASPAVAGRAHLNGASDPADARATLIASGTSTGSDSVYGPGYTAPIHDGWG